MMCDAAAGAIAEVIEENDRMRIVRFTLAPGAATGWHTHALDYVIVPYDDCRVRVDRRDGTVEAEMFKDKPYFREKGVEHNVTSLLHRPFAFLEIELKT